MSPRLFRLHQEACRATEKSGGFQHALDVWKSVYSQAEVDGALESEIALQAKNVIDNYEDNISHD